MSDESKEVSLFEVIGGRDTITIIVNRFYHYMDTLPEAKDIRLQHQEDLSEANHKLNFFLTGWLGGPPLYIEKYGHPRLRARHLPFAIGMKERDQWLLCMFRALDEIAVEKNIDASIIKNIKSAIYRLADHMRNQEEQ